jgi:two-component system osmolarity sensor histidine kinase EnvZ
MTFRAARALARATGDAVAAAVRRPLRQALRRFRALMPVNRVNRALNRVLPKGLYARSLLIIVTPMVLLQSVLVFVFMERHWELVTRRLSAAVSRDIAALIDIYESYPQDPRAAVLERIAQNRLELSVDFMPPEPLPAPGPKPFFSLLDSTLSDEISQRVKQPFWIDTVGRSRLVEIRVRLDNAVLRVFAQRSQTYASNSHIFLVWMVCTSLVLLAVAIAFLRNQIRPILRLAQAAESFGKGRDAPRFRPAGAREVRQAAQAFLEMKKRIERHVDQRTAMLAGVSHDLRTVLTRFRLQVALLGETPETEALTRDVDDMQTMLEAYLAFAKGDGGEQVGTVDIAALLGDARSAAERHGAEARARFDGDPQVRLRPNALKRLLDNLVSNACRYADRVTLAGRHADGWLEISIDDDGPGIPPDKREDVFRPFYRLDDARNQDRGGTGLGLAIARDIARGHGGDIFLEDSPMGGLRARVRLPA